MKRVMISHCRKTNNNRLLSTPQLRSATIDFTQSPSQFIQQLKSVPSPSSTSTSSSQGNQQQLKTRQSLVQIQSLNQHLTTRAESLVQSLNRMIDEAETYPKRQQELLEEFKRMTSSSSSQQQEEESTTNTTTTTTTSDILNQLTSFEQYLSRFQFVQSTLHHVNEHVLNQGFHQAHATLFNHSNSKNSTTTTNNNNNNNPLLTVLNASSTGTTVTNALNTTSYHHYPLIYSLDMFMTSVLNAFELGDVHRAQSELAEFVARLKSLSQLIDRSLVAYKRRVALLNAEFKSSGKYGVVGSGVEDVEGDLEELRRLYYSVPSHWTVLNNSGNDSSSKNRFEFDPILGNELPNNIDAVMESVVQYEAQAHLTLVEILSLTSHHGSITEAEQVLKTRLEDPTLENTLSNALDVGGYATLKARNGQLEEAIPLFSRAIKQLLAFPRTSLLRHVYEQMMLLCQVRLGQKSEEATGDLILKLVDSLSSDATTATAASTASLKTGTKKTTATATAATTTTATTSEEEAQSKHYTRLVLVDLLLSRNNGAQALAFIDQMIASRGIPHQRVTSFDYPYLLQRRAEALAMTENKNSSAIQQTYEQAIAIAIEQVGANGYKLPLIYNSYANYCEQVLGDVNKATELRNKMQSVLAHNNVTLDNVKNADLFSFVLIGLSLPRAYPLIPTESPVVKQEGIDSLQRFNQLREDIFNI